MNKQGPKGIGWTNYTWNPITGCSRNCWYCYVKRLPGYSRQVEFHPKRLYEPLSVKKPSRIFVCSTGDFFDRAVNADWRFEVYNIMNQSPQHDYQILTKCYDNLDKYYPDNAWLGITLDGKFKEVLDAVHRLDLTFPKVKFLSLEPLLDPMAEALRICLLEYDIKIDWIIIGAMTGEDSLKYQPRKSWIDDILQIADLRNIPVFMKENLKPLYPGMLRQEWPEFKKDKGKKK